MKGRNIKEAELNKMQRMIDAGMADDAVEIRLKELEALKDV